MMAMTVRQVKRQKKLSTVAKLVPPSCFFVKGEVDSPCTSGNSAYKPVPPPKRVLVLTSHPQEAGGSSTPPPPYRMPPYPLYHSHEPPQSATAVATNVTHFQPPIPGAAIDTTAPLSSPHHSNLHTHSSKFPIEREVILSSGDKNSKIPILNEYRKRSKAVIAPDAPNKQLAWTEDKNRCGDPTMQVNASQETMPVHQVYKAQPMTLLDSSQMSEPSPIRPQDHMNGYSR
ncbi:hypothetical protein LSTR_LSTR017595 [Laodelphax striatellus]|uniref:Uncharacterized protein n=1 Tax=Laodelphax striatellus TaxID=195883 RepID=A0A482XKY3_LAOST|nr:hypothetical protein LSTR_LSTR017595 [Laodelphax striatellus]